MNTTAFHPVAPRHHGPQQRQRPERNRRPEPLTDDQYMATSLALVANLSLRVRNAGARRHG